MTLSECSPKLGRPVPLSSSSCLRPGMSIIRGTRVSFPFYPWDGRCDYGGLALTSQRASAHKAAVIETTTICDTACQTDPLPLVS
jgi:hypothetical protein